MQAAAHGVPCSQASVPLQKFGSKVCRSDIHPRPALCDWQRSQWLYRRITQLHKAEADYFVAMGTTMHCSHTNITHASSRQHGPSSGRCQQQQRRIQAGVGTLPDSSICQRVKAERATSFWPMAAPCTSARRTCAHRRARNCSVFRQALMSCCVPSHSAASACTKGAAISAFCIQMLCLVQSWAALLVLAGCWKMLRGNPC